MTDPVTPPEPRPLTAMSQAELLDLFDQSAGDPELRAAIRAVVVERPAAPAAEAGPGLDEDAFEATARRLAGPTHRAGAIPHRFWREAYAALRAALEPRS